MFNNKVFIGIAAAVALLVVILALGMRGGYVSFTSGSFVPHITVAPTRMPSLDRPIDIPQDFSPEARAMLQERIEASRRAIEKGDAKIDVWYDLALNYKTVGDYAGAVEIWTYLSTIDPKDGVSLHNIGEYYFHTAKDYPTAEKYYLQSLAVTPKLEQDYMDLFDMYSVYKTDTTAAVDIMKQGIAELGLPTSIDLMGILGQYYENKGDKPNARMYYTQARDGAAEFHNTQLVAQFNKALQRVK